LESHHDRLAEHVSTLHEVMNTNPVMRGALEGKQRPKPQERFDMSAMAGVYSDMRNYFAQQPIAPISLDTLLQVKDQNTLRHNAQYLHRELPVRLAHRVRDLDTFPYGLSHMLSIQKVKHMYIQSFADLRSANLPCTTADLIQFHEILSTIYRRHATTIHLISLGVQELKASMNMGRSSSVRSLPELAPMLDTFISSRIGIRLLIRHYLTLCRALLPGVRLDPGLLEHALFGHEEMDFHGVVCTNCNIRTVAEIAIRDVQEVVKTARSTVIETCYPSKPASTVACIASDVYTICLELLKNAVRAHSDAGNASPIKVHVLDEKEGPRGEAEDIIVSIEDQGSGIRRSEQIWSYLYSTKTKEGSPGGNAILIGEGFGLPLSRIHARHFGGDLKIRSVEGIGTAAYVYVPRKTNQKETI